MLRGLVVLLMVANLGFFGWSQGWLDGVVGVRARGDREPERLLRQVRPETVVVVSPPASAGSSAGLAACVEAGPFPPSEVAAAESALRTVLPNGGWSNIRVDRPGTWLIYMGSFPDRAAMLRKVEEIRRSRLVFEEVVVPNEGEFGLSLGRFQDLGSAERTLAQMMQRGVRTARVVPLSAPATWHMLRIEGADPVLAARAVGPALQALGKGFSPCPGNEPGR
jgi:hypothetical protein